MRPDQRGVTSLAQWLEPDHGQRRLDRLRMAAASAEFVGQDFERVEAELADALPVIHEPVVVPVRKQVQRQIKP